MPKGRWAICGVTKPKPDGKNYWTCRRIQGHKEKAGGDNQKHCDTRTSPTYYWKDDEEK